MRLERANQQDVLVNLLSIAIAFEHSNPTGISKIDNITSKRKIPDLKSELGVTKRTDGQNSIWRTDVNRLKHDQIEHKGKDE